MVASHGTSCVSLWKLPRDWHPHPFPLPDICLFYYDRYNVYQDFHFASIPLTLIGMLMLNWFAINTNIDVGNAIFP